jgi:hypothetical protein
MTPEQYSYATIPPMARRNSPRSPRHIVRRKKNLSPLPSTNSQDNEEQVSAQGYVDTVSQT